MSRFARSIGLLSLLSLANRPVGADQPPFYDSTKYNEGEYGLYVTQEFFTSEARAPWLNFILPFSNCDDGSYIFVAPRGYEADATPFILDAEGSMIWTWDEHYGEIYNFAAQTYKGEQYLTFWVGDDSIGGHGEGKYMMLDKHYELYREIKGAHDVGADLHSFVITEDDTAVFTLYEKKEIDIPDIRPDEPTVWVWDAMVQEIDIETGEALFEWHASDHVSLGDSYIDMDESKEDHPWDYFHINSVEKDEFGNYLISSRHYRMLAYIDGSDGSILWRLGGKNNSFEDLSDGAATLLVGQHDAHWTADHSAVTFFDNRGDWQHQISPESWGARVRLDTDTMTAELEQTYKHPEGVYTFSQGSCQTLPNGNVLLGYGYIGAFAEFSPEGKLLCDAVMEPKSEFTSGNVQSYRNLKFNWTGIPKTEPSLAYHQSALYMSWKGTTETRKWQLQTADSPHGHFNPILTIAKAGFETRYPLSSGLCTKKFVRVVALDRNGEILSTSSPIFMEDDAGQCAGEWRSKPETPAPAGMPFHEVIDEDPEGDLASQVLDLQLLLGFASLAVLVGFFITWLTLGSRVFAPCRRLFATEDISRPPRGRMLRKLLLVGGLWSGIWVLVRDRFSSSPTKRWWESNGHQNRRSEDFTGMLSDVELSGDEDKMALGKEEYKG